MLETAAKKGVRPMIERHAISDVNAAMERVVSGGAGGVATHYRAFLGSLSEEW